MGADQGQVFDGTREEAGGFVADIAVTGAVKAVAPNAVILVEFVGQGVEISLSGHALVEGGIEDHDLG